MSNTIPNINFSNINIKNIAFHITNYIDLFVKPTKVWKDVINNRTNSIELVVRHFFYYFLFIGIIIFDFQRALYYVLLESILTVIPFIVFYIPFKFVVKFFKYKLKTKKFFHLLLIIKLQLLPLIILLLRLSKSLDDDLLYIISDNLTFLIWIAFIFILPLISTLSNIKKICWIFINYLSFLFYFIVLFFLSHKSNQIDIFFSKIAENLNFISPNYEYSSYNSQSNYFVNSIDNNYILIYSKKNNDKTFFSNTQILTNQLSVDIFTISQKQIIEQLIELGDTSKRDWLDSLNKLPTERILTFEKFDSIRNINLSLFSKELILVKKYYDSTRFISNRKYFESINQYLTNYKEILNNDNLINDFISKDENPISIQFDNDHKIYLFKMKSPLLNAYNEKCLIIQEYLEYRFSLSFAIAKIFLTPLDFIYNKLQYDTNP